MAAGVLTIGNRWLVEMNSMLTDFLRLTTPLEEATRQAQDFGRLTAWTLMGGIMLVVAWLAWGRRG